MAENEIDPELLAEVRLIHADATDARAQLSRIEESRRQDRRILNRIQFLVVAKLLTLVLLVLVSGGMWQSLHLVQQTNHTLQDCLLPTGTCAQRNSALQAQLILSLSYQTQAQQLETSLRIAKANGNIVTIPVFEQRQQETADVLQQIKENVIDINNGKPPRHIIPTELPIATNGSK